ncbi:MAG TPA: lytic murein transglycosylase [Alphaproteobacteria bacterium]|nr:lytic murein transglycosylase [Alphaproteobacteria bacterium]
MLKLFFVSISLITLLSQHNAYSASAEGFNSWKKSFTEEAVQKGIRRATVENALRDVSYNPKIVQLDRSQPEFKINFQEYKRKVITEARINKAKKLLKENYKLLDEVERFYGVPKRFIVALWGVETSFGEVTGNFYIPAALATLAYDGRRQEFFKAELLHSLKILDEGHISKDKFKGSWAGAMGQCQFMPSSFFKFAQDYNQDGKKDIWATRPDVFASIANYLLSVGWNQKYNWGQRVILPVRFNKSLVNDKINRPLQFFNKMGVRTLTGRFLPFENINARIISPDDDAARRGEYYIVYSNFDAIMHWNRSTYFATSVGLIADSIE